MLRGLGARRARERDLLQGGGLRGVGDEPAPRGGHRADQVGLAAVEGHLGTGFPAVAMDRRSTIGADDEIRTSGAVSANCTVNG